MTTIQELIELYKERKEWEEEGTPLDKASLRQAMSFARLLSGLVKDPHVEVHPDGEIAFCWRQKDCGMLYVCFSSDGVIYWSVLNDDGKDSISINGKACTTKRRRMKTNETKEK